MSIAVNYLKDKNKHLKLLHLANKKATVKDALIIPYKRFKNIKKRLNNCNKRLF
jgi:hypothetical protein